MKDPENISVNDIVEDLNNILEEENCEKLSEIELEELMDALDTPGL